MDLLSGTLYKITPVNLSQDHNGEAFKVAPAYRTGRKPKLFATFRVYAGQ
jgi:hypothetical protein